MEYMELLMGHDSARNNSQIGYRVFTVSNIEISLTHRLLFQLDHGTNDVVVPKYITAVRQD